MGTLISQENTPEYTIKVYKNEYGCRITIRRPVLTAEEYAARIKDLGETIAAVMAGIV